MKTAISLEGFRMICRYVAKGLQQREKEIFYQELKAIVVDQYHITDDSWLWLDIDNSCITVEYAKGLSNPIIFEDTETEGLTEYCKRFFQRGRNCSQWRRDINGKRIHNW